MIKALLLGVLLPLSWPIAAKAEPAPPPALACAGAFVQGGLVLCRAAPGATLVVDGEARGAADADGWLVLGFDRDAAARTTVEVRSPDGEIARETYAIAPRQFPISRVDGLPPQTVTPTDPAILRKIERDQQLKARIHQSRADLQGWLQGLNWPVRGRISSGWGAQRILNGAAQRPHYGVDIAVPTGTPILAPAAGVVVLAHPDLHFEGGMVVLDHGQGLYSYYLHMSRVDVAEGAIIGQGQTIGAVGATGRATGPHLCWRMRWRDRQIDPTAAMEGLQTARAALGG